MLLLPDLRVRQRDYLLEISRAITAQLDLGEVLRLILRASAAMLAGEVGLIALRDESSDGLRVRAVFGIPPEQVSAFSPLLETFEEGYSEQDSATLTDKVLRTIASSLGMPLRQVIALPMNVAGELVGMIYVFRAFSGTASLNDRLVLQSFADQAAIAVHNARLYQAVNRERQRLAGILENNADGVMILDSNRVILRFNKAMSRISGWSAEQANGQLYEAVVSWTSPPQGSDLAEAIQTGWPQVREGYAPPDTLYVEGDLQRPDGTAISVGITHAPLVDGDGRLLNVIVNVRDITHFRKVQEMQSTFVSVVSHELKTPVALIKGYAGTLRRKDANWDPAIIEQSLAVIEDEADRLTELIENLLAASKLQADGLSINMDPVRLDEITQLAVSRFETQSSRHRFVLDFMADFPTVMGDHQRLRQVLDNLLSNAVKYSPNGGEIRVSGVYNDTEVRVSVTDQGIGLPRDEWERIFDRFYRVDDAMTSKTKGTGLGLYLSRAVIEAHGGTIAVESMPGQGATFYFTLPRKNTLVSRERSKFA